MTWHLRLLGRFALFTKSGRSLEISSLKGRALLAFLALERGRPQARHRLMDLLWSDRSEAQARSNLRQVLWILRQALPRDGGSPLIIRRDEVALALGLTDVDALKFADLAATDRLAALQAAVALYGGDLLDGLHIHDRVFEDWLARERSCHDQLFTETLIKLLDRYEQASDHDRTRETAERLISHDPLQETAYRSLMKLYGRRGDRNRALQAYHRCCEALAEDLGIGPDAATRRLHQQILHGLGPGAWPGAEAAPVHWKSAEICRADPIRKPSVAVTPFASLNGDPEQAYFASGFTEDIITELTRFKAIRVSTAPNFGASQGALRHSSVAPQVRYHVRGSLRQWNGRIRITAHLVDVESDCQVWAEHFDRKLDNIFEVEEELVRGVAGSLAANLEGTEVQRAGRKRPENMDALDHFLRALPLIDRYNPADVAEAGRALCTAVRLEPGYADAYGHLAWVASYQALLQDTPEASAERLETALELAMKAVDLDPNDSQTHAKLAEIHLFRQEYDEARLCLDRSLALNPSNPMHLNHRAMVLIYSGQSEQALQLLKQFAELMPTLPTWYWENLAEALYNSGRFAEAARAFDRMPVLNPWDRLGLAACWGQLGETDRAQRQFRIFSESSPPLLLRSFAELYVKEADRTLWREGLRKAGLPH